LRKLWAHGFRLMEFLVYRPQFQVLQLSTREKSYVSSKRLTSRLMNSTGTQKMFAAATIMDERHLDIGHVLAISHTPVVDIAPVHTGKSNYVIVVSCCLSLCHLHIFITHLAIADNDCLLQSSPSKHYYECIALFQANSLQDDRFWTLSLAFINPMSKEVRSLVIFLSWVECNQLLQAVSLRLKIVLSPSLLQQIWTYFLQIRDL